MRRLTRLDISRRLNTPAAKAVSQVLFGVACALIMMAVRSLLDYFAPTSGPFALVYPAVLIATLFGHWLGGLSAFTISFVWAWWFVLPTVGSFHFEIPTDPPRVLINASAAFVIIIFAEAFRRAVQENAAARDLEIARRAMLMQELEHRTKNNFAMVAALLEMQKRGLEDEEVIAALNQAIGRVHAFATAYSVIIPHETADNEHFPVNMRQYLHDIVSPLASASFSENVAVSLDAEKGDLPHRVAVAIGLFVNEALTNCAKYAFPDGRAGKVCIAFSAGQDKWQLTVSDDGVGHDTHAREKRNSIGTSLMKAFAVQAEAEYEVLTAETGHSVRLSGALS
ncbi:sensor histidine kinase [Rhizobium sp. L1K21]|uniref:sensor histidine kinase n=1 Tax=Rhizobium sp. L1K21 TaxID=2954933 RepID=UPI0020928E94|nr:histidine kinase dimerization/phosphoacceptor domain -containing protein [Rhizobium sp. L1K21]MCO6186506.1 DUF4118 domain-containing protein [Rhizobium sp. L1K21]